MRFALLILTKQILTSNLSVWTSGGIECLYVIESLWRSLVIKTSTIEFGTAISIYASIHHPSACLIVAMVTVVSTQKPWY